MGKPGEEVQTEPDFKEALRASTPPDDAAPPTNAAETPPASAGAPAGGTPDPAAPAAPAAPPARTLEQVERELAELKDPKHLEGAQLEWARSIAKLSPAHYRMMTGMEPPPGMQFPEQGQGGAPAAPKPGEQANPDDPTAALKKQVDALTARDAQRESAARSQAVKDDVYDNFEKFEDVYDPQKNNLAGWAQQAAGDAVRREMLAGRRPDIAKIVADTAKSFRDHIQAIKDSYKQGKVEAGKTIPAGAGKPGGPVPERTAPNPAGGGTRRELAAALKEGGGITL